MSEGYVLTAEARDRVGKGSARAIRRQGDIPAVIYGDNKPPMTITLPRKDVWLKIQQGGFLTTVGEIEVGGKKHKVLAKDYQLEPVKDFVLHVDFLRISARTIVTVNIPVHFVNEEDAPGIVEGGVLNVVRHEVEVNCPADAIPEYFTVDLSGAQLGDALKISSVALPEGVEVTITDRDFTLATIASPAGLKSDEEEAEAEVAPDEVEATEQKGDAEGEGEGEEEGGEE